MNEHTNIAPRLNRKKSGFAFWKVAFVVYAIAEAAYITTNYFITKRICEQCLLRPPWYVLNFFNHLVFTGLLWYSLNITYGQRMWKKIIINILLFVTYYFLWIILQYSLLHSGKAWFSGNPESVLSFQRLVYNSWFDIGKYAIKLSAFYVLKFYVDYRKAEKERIQLAIINKDMQLNLLKQQLSPHFYFNTLNNLYGLARINSSKLAAALDQLYIIMQYVITDCSQPKVLLKQEIMFLKSYIALEKLRYEQNTVIEMNVEGNANGQTILPLVLIQFVENAFKHGMKEKSDDNWLKVKMCITNNEVFFKVDNSFYESKPHEGIGISSVKRILNLHYEGKYQMSTLHEEHRYSVTLKLNLS